MVLTGRCSHLLTRGAVHSQLPPQSITWWLYAHLHSPLQTFTLLPHMTLLPYGSSRSGQTCSLTLCVGKSLGSDRLVLTDLQHPPATISLYSRTPVRRWSWPGIYSSMTPHSCPSTINLILQMKTEVTCPRLRGEEAPPRRDLNTGSLNILLTPELSPHRLDLPKRGRCRCCSLLHILPQQAHSRPPGKLPSTPVASTAGTATERRAVSVTISTPEVTPLSLALLSPCERM